MKFDINLSKYYSIFILVGPHLKVRRKFNKCAVHPRSYRRRFIVGSWGKMRWPKRDRGHVRRWNDVQPLQQVHRLQLGHLQMQNGRLLSASFDHRSGHAQRPIPRHLQQILHRQVNGNPTQPLDGRKGRRMDETTNVRGANVKRERRRKTRIYISDFPNYLLHFTM